MTMCKYWVEIDILVKVKYDKGPTLGITVISNYCHNMQYALLHLQDYNKYFFFDIFLFSELCYNMLGMTIYMVWSSTH